jgi:hypothetical protein
MAEYKSKDKQQTSKEKQLIKRINAMFDIAKRSRSNVNKLWRESEEMYAGEHWRGSNMPKYQNQMTLDLIASAIDTMIPILSSRPPKIDVLPSSTDEVDRKIAETMQIQMDDLWEMRDMQNVMSEWIMDFLVYGTGIMKTYFGEDDLPECKVVDPFSFFVNPSATRLENADWVIYAAPVPLHEIRHKYPEKAQYVKADSNLENFEALRINDIGQDNSTKVVINDPTTNSTSRYSSEGAAAEDLEERVLLIECWWRSGEHDYVDAEKSDSQVSKIPGSRLTVIAGDCLLHDGPSPYPFLNKQHYIQHPFPFVVAKNGGSAHSFYGKPEPKRLKSLNLGLDRVASQIADNIHLMANPMWVVDETAQVTDSLVNKPGSVVRKKGPGTVAQVSPAPMPGYVFNFYQMMYDIFEVVSGVNRATQGREAPNVTSGVQAETLQRAATTKIEYKSRAIDVSVQQLGAQWLSMIQNLSTEEHVVSVPTDAGMEMRGYKGVMFKDQPMRVRSKTGSMLPVNKMFIEQKVLQLLQAGIIQDPEFVLENIELPGKQRILDKLREQKQLQEEADRDQASQMAKQEEILSTSTDEDEIMNILQQQQAAMEPFGQE